MTIERQPNSLLVELKLPLSEDTLINDLPSIKYLPVWEFLADWNPTTGGNNFDKIQGCLQAFQHLHDLQDFQRCEQLLLLALDTPTSHQLMIQATDRLLHLQIQIWGYNQRAIELYYQILDRVGTSHQHTC
ncbi:MAG: hypothetical protein HC778_00480 [Chamaesiphon sp. CSU_1_12]|nr:hypothetical protein [Chamaesiphon sp. CSU_1_12]